MACGCQINNCIKEMSKVLLIERLRRIVGVRLASNKRRHRNAKSLGERPNLTNV